jgi:hypothetical protein
MMKGPPGWEPHRIQVRLDGWVGSDPSHAPASVAEAIACAMPQPTEVEIIRARMLARQRMMERRHGNE